jgi:hypothetical protein
MVQLVEILAFCGMKIKVVECLVTSHKSVVTSTK